MLHILLLILKIIGFILLGILALILALLLIILLTPFRYRVSARTDGAPENTEGAVAFHWLFHLISGEAAWKDGELSWRIRAAWKKFGSGSDEPGSADGPDAPDTAPEDAPSTDEAAAEASPGSEDRIPPVENSGEAGCTEPETEETKKTEKQIMSGHPEHNEERRTERARINLYEKICALFNRIKYTFQQFCVKIKSLNRKKERLTAFLTNETHKKAFSRLASETRKLLRRLRPDRAYADITFGFEDPAYTGYTLAGISLIYPVIGGFTYLNPDFEHKVLQGEVYIRGRVRLVCAVLFAWNMVVDKNVRLTYRHLRKFKL